MSRADMLTVTGKVTQVFNANAYEVQLPNGHLVRCHRGGHARKRCQKPTIGDEVQVDISPYDMGKGIIKNVVTATKPPRTSNKGRPR